MIYFGVLTVSIGVEDGGGRGWHFPLKFGENLGKYHVKCGNFVNFSYVFWQKCISPKLTELLYAYDVLLLIGTQFQSYLPYWITHCYLPPDSKPVFGIPQKDGRLS